MSEISMEKIAQIVAEVMAEQGIVKDNEEDKLLSIGISNRHIHLSQEDLETCFGKGYELTPIKDLTQPGQYACKETMTVVGPKGSIEKVRVLGPVRKATQVELLGADNFKLGTKAPLRISGDTKDSGSVTLVGPKGSVLLKEGAIVAKRHIHMTEEDAKKHGVKDGDVVSMEILGDRGGILNNVIIRANNKSYTECHLDSEEANALGVTPNTKFRIIK